MKSTKHTGFNLSRGRIYHLPDKELSICKPAPRMGSTHSSILKLILEGRRTTPQAPWSPDWIQKAPGARPLNVEGRIHKGINTKIKLGAIGKHSISEKSTLSILLVY